MGDYLCAHDTVRMTYTASLGQSAVILFVGPRGTRARDSRPECSLRWVQLSNEIRRTAPARKEVLLFWWGKCKYKLATFLIINSIKHIENQCGIRALRTERETASLSFERLKNMSNFLPRVELRSTMDPHANACNTLRRRTILWTSKCDLVNFLIGFDRHSLRRPDPERSRLCFAENIYRERSLPTPLN